MDLNIYAAWVLFLLGAVAGAVTGLFFHDKDWLGGYGSWRRRLVRLGHISFFGIGLLNLCFALTAVAFDISSGLAVPSFLFVLGGAAMPAVCYLSAWRPGFRHLFFIPAGSVTVAIALFLWKLLVR